MTRLGAQRNATTFLAAAVAIAGLLAWFEWRQWRDARNDVRTGHATLVNMRNAAQTIRLLRDTPQAVASHTRTSEDLLAQVEEAIETTALARSRWRDSIPQPAVRLAKTDYEEHATRLYFDAVSLRQVIALTHRLVSQDRTLRLSSLDLTSRQTSPDTYDVDLTLSYLLYVPVADRRG